jgi:L-2-hydroxyglutarate oxidase LhgO
LSATGPRIGVVGAGIIGLAVARRLTQLRPDATVTVLEKEPRVAVHQTGHNSGVVHAGIYYPPGSLKAQLCRSGIGMLSAYCKERSLPYEEAGKLIVARDPAEVGRLRELERRAMANGVPAIRWLDAEQLREVEPRVRGLAALHSPTTAITDFPAVAVALADDIRRAGGELRLGAQVTDVRVLGSRAHVLAAGQGFVFDVLVICAGLQTDRLARKAGDSRGPAIVPFRGEYFRLVPGREDLVRGLIYPVPDPSYPFLGVHFTRRVTGGVEVGPNAVLAFAREGYRRTDIRFRDIVETLSWPGFRSLARRHWRTGAHELLGSLSKRAFAAKARAFVPELSASDLVPAPAGVRAQALDEDGSLVDDFRIHRIGPITAVRNAPSPGATSSLAIAERIASRALDEWGSRGHRPLV